MEANAPRGLILPRIAAGECYFGIGMSEPDSRSDLAAVRTKAEKCEIGWVINGAKIWTSNAHRVHYLIVLARTEPPGQDRRCLSAVHRRYRVEGGRDPADTKSGGRA